MPNAPTIRRHLVVFLGYLLLAALLTYPLILRLTTHVPGDGRDDPPLVWNLWWVRHALLDLHTNPLNCAYLFYPIGVNLTYFTLTIFNAFLSVPAQLTGGVVLASNVNLLFSYAIAGFAMYLLALDVLAGSGRRRSQAMYVAAFVAGLVYAFAPIKMIFASLGQFNMTSTQWLPLCVLYLLRMLRPPAVAASASARPLPLRLPALLWPPADRQGQRAALLAALFLLITAYAEFTFASFIGIFLAVHLVYLLFTRRRAVLAWPVLGRLLLLGGIFVIGFWPILGSMMREMALEGDYSLSAGWGFADIFAADLLGFLLPGELHPLLGPWAQRVASTFTYANFASVGIVVLSLSVVGMLAGRRGDGHPSAPAAFWGMSALLYAILSLGPVLHIAGRWVFDLDGLLVRVPLPFIILHYIPFIKANRYPSRLHVLVMLCLAVLVAFAIEALLVRTRMNAERARTETARHNQRRAIRADSRSLLTGVIIAALLFEYLAVPLPLSDLRTPRVYETIAAESKGAPILQLPVSWRNSFQFIPQSFTSLPQSVNTVVMFEQFYQTTHQGPVVSGNTSRNPQFKFTYFLEAPIIRSIVALEEGRALSAEQLAYDRWIATEALRFFGFTHVVLHPPLVGGPVEDYVRAVFPLTSMAADSGLSAYRVSTPAPGAPSGPLVIDMGSDLSNLYRAEGWGEAQDIGGQRGRWSDRAAARLLVPMQAGRPATLALSLAGTQPSPAFDVLVNGTLVYRGSTGAERTIIIDVDGSVPRDGINDVVLRVARLAPLGPAAQGEAVPVGQSVVATRHNLVVHSAGLDAGGDLGFAHVYVDGKDVLTGGRGLNVAVIEPGSGRVERTARFDVSTDPAANRAFLQLIEAAPAGRIVAVAVMDDASLSFSEDSLAALRMIGAQVDLRGQLRRSYAAIGVKGAAPGQALEHMAQGRPASVAVGAHVYGRGLGVALSRVTVEQ